MTSISSKILDAFRNLRSDAVPKAPRPDLHEKTDDVTKDSHNNENIDHLNDQEEEIFIENDDNTDEKTKPKKSFFGSKKKREAPQNSHKEKKRSTGSHSISINTQATGNVINVIDTNNFRWGNDYVYYLGPTNGQNKSASTDVQDEEQVEKTNLIILLMEATIPAEHEYIDYISKNLGKNWHSFFRKLGYTKGRIETFEIDEAVNGVSEARYKLLLDWIRNDNYGTLGRLATLLWEEGERHIVRELSLIYQKNKK